MREAIAVALLVAGLAVQLLAVLGVVLIRDALDRVHFLGLSTLSVACIAAAVVVRDSFSLIGIRALLIAAFVAGTAPVLSHLTARAIVHAREGADS